MTPLARLAAQLEELSLDELLMLLAPRRVVAEAADDGEGLDPVLVQVRITTGR